MIFTLNAAGKHFTNKNLPYSPCTSTQYPIFVKKSIMDKSFNPSAAATADTGVFGLPCTAEQAQIILIPVNWELTVSYGKGTFEGPEAIYNASMQIDLYNHDYPNLWEKVFGWIVSLTNLKPCTTA